MIIGCRAGEEPWCCGVNTVGDFREFQNRDDMKWADCFELKDAAKHVDGGGLMLATINTEEQGYVRAELIRLGWKKLIKFTNPNHNSPVEVWAKRRRKHAGDGST